jgi:hypothetical protein
MSGAGGAKKSAIRPLIKRPRPLVHVAWLVWGLSPAGQWSIRAICTSERIAGIARREIGQAVKSYGAVQIKVERASIDHLFGAGDIKP